MKKYIILIISLFLFGCVAAQQPRNFNVMPTFCYDGECFSVEKKSNIMLVNTNMPAGDYKIKKVKKEILLGDERTDYKLHSDMDNLENSDYGKIETDYIHMRVHNDIVTIEIEDTLIQYNQKTRKVIHVVDKSGDSTPIQTNTIKEFFQKAFGLNSPSYISSGQVIPLNFKANFGGGEGISFNNFDSYIHGETYYKNKVCSLIEIKGEGEVKTKDSSVPVTISGYSLRDSTLNLDVKSVVDMTYMMEDGSSVRGRTIIMQKIVQ